MRISSIDMFFSFFFFKKKILSIYIQNRQTTESLVNTTIEKVWDPNKNPQEIQESSLNEIGPLVPNKKFRR